MIKKISTFFAVLMIASSASVAFGCPSKGDDDSADTGATKLSLVDVAGSGCSDSCGDKKDEA